MAAPKSMANTGSSGSRYNSRLPMEMEKKVSAGTSQAKMAHIALEDFRFFHPQ